MKLIEKESLNIEKCRQDLLYDLKGTYPLHLLSFFTTALLAGILYLAGPFAFESSDVPHWVFALFWLVPAGYFAGYVTYVLRKWLWLTKAPFSVVEDTFCGAHAILRDRGSFKSPVLRYWEIYFSEHGIFRTTMSHATWSRKGNRMNCAALVSSSNTGDRFYLLLDEQSKKDGKPKIVLAYPCKYFQWQDEIV